MHPWMLEQVAREHRRDLLAVAARPRVRPAWTWRKLAAYITMTRPASGATPVTSTPNAAPMLAPLPGGDGIETEQGVVMGAAGTSKPGQPARISNPDQPARPASAA
jgi:hypothetical protein